jgi:hypothetical protein
MKKLKTITACIALGAMMLCTSAFASENDGKDKKETKPIGYVWANPTLCGTCSKTGGADAGADKWYSTGLCCTPPTIGGTTSLGCGSGNNACGPCQKTYSWLPTTGLDYPNICNPTATPGTTTNYTLTVTYTCGHTQCQVGGQWVTYDCCLDACDGLNRTCAGPTYCAGSPSWTDVVTVTVNNNDCCRLQNPGNNPEISDERAKVYPNPSPGIFTFEQGGIMPGMVIRVYDIEGNMVWISPDMSSSKQTIDLTDQSKGVYFIQVKYEDKVTFFKKIIVQ